MQRDSAIDAWDDDDLDDDGEDAVFVTAAVSSLHSLLRLDRSYIISHQPPSLSLSLALGDASLSR